VWAGLGFIANVTGKHSPLIRPHTRPATSHPHGHPLSFCFLYAQH